MGGTRKTPPASSTHPIFNRLFIQQLFIEHLVCAKTTRDQRDGAGPPSHKGLKESLGHPEEHGGNRKTYYPHPRWAGTDAAQTQEISPSKLPSRLLAPSLPQTVSHPFQAGSSFLNLS